MISFGPVPSRRLGKSLGINNIIRPKVCTYSCVYCQVGKTERLSVKRQSFFDPDLIFNEVTRHLDKLQPSDMPDYLTFVSNGEPTLDVNLGKSVSMLKKLGIPVAVITNSSLLWQEQVRIELAAADWVSVKIDAADDVTWKKMNRPSSDLEFKTCVEGVMDFGKYYKGKLVTETMLCGGINDSEENIKGVTELIKRSGAVKAYISVPIRPPADPEIIQPDADHINMAWQIFNEAEISTELLTGFEGAETGYTGNSYEDILNITAVHPLREDTLQELLRKNKSNFSIMQSLLDQRLVKCSVYRGKKFYIRNYQIDN